MRTLKPVIALLVALVILPIGANPAPLTLCFEACGHIHMAQYDCECEDAAQNSAYEPAGRSLMESTAWSQDDSNRCGPCIDITMAAGIAALTARSHGLFQSAVNPPAILTSGVSFESVSNAEISAFHVNRARILSPPISRTAILRI